MYSDWTKNFTVVLRAVWETPFFGTSRPCCRKMSAHAKLEMLGKSFYSLRQIMHFVLVFPTEITEKCRTLFSRRSNTITNSSTFNWTIFHILCMRNRTWCREVMGRKNETLIVPPHFCLIYKLSYKSTTLLKNKNKVFIQTDS